MNKTRVEKIKRCFENRPNLDVGTSQIWTTIAKGYRARAKGNMDETQKHFTRNGLCYAACELGIPSGYGILAGLAGFLGINPSGFECWFWTLDEAGARKRDSLAQDIAEALRQMGK
jgi:hypothetical protein